MLIHSLIDPLKPKSFSTGIYTRVCGACTEHVCTLAYTKPTASILKADIGLCRGGSRTC